MGLEREVQFLSNVIDRDYFGSVDRRGPHVFVEWPDEVGMHLLRKLSAARIELEDLFLSPVEIVNAGRGCFFAHYTVRPVNIVDFMNENSVGSGVRWPIIRKGLANIHLKYGISKIQFIANFKKATIHRGCVDPKVKGLQN